ncbi:MAG: amylosucrase [Chloroflexi bacterium HGW-Chloroflexi-2]|jgi:glycosidase|nr:MAG: amylosucrase [Chloroflexi bacterium HGW-Chloroflexi-2]
MDIQYQAQFTYERLLPRLQNRFKEYAKSHPEDWNQFVHRLDFYFPTLFRKLFPLYGEIYDAIYFIEELFYALAESWINRPGDLKKLDKKREANPQWFQSENMLGAVCYVDLFSDDLKGFYQKIPYLCELGVTYLHLMPLFKTPEGENDGGYAISSYREVNPNIGTMDELIDLGRELRKNGISLVLDFVFNHTSNEHEWALKAQSGDPIYENYYWIYPDRRMPDAYEAQLREIFPDEHPGAFTYFESIDKWVWTTFHSYQWDLNYQNPAVFVEMAREMLFLANAGVEILRLDAVAFIWKRMGTNCENLPEAHLLIQAFNLIARIAAPSLLFKSEAIVHPDDVIKYISPEKCQISYNPLLMALLWESLATREVRLLKHSMQKRLALPDQCAWVNYVRCHDDIGWTFSDDDAAELWINGFDHRQFLNEFYRGRFPGSFARGLPFQENPKTGDSRISGTCASLAGLEKAIAIETGKEVDLAIKRIVLIHGIIMTIGGIPLIYLGDELGTLNDYHYLEDKSKAHDSRWVHRPKFDSKKSDNRTKKNTIEGKIYKDFLRLIQIRKNNSVFRNLNTEILDIDNPHVFGYIRKNNSDYIIALANFSEKPQEVVTELILSKTNKQLVDIESEQILNRKIILLAPYDLRFIRVQ